MSKQSANWEDIFARYQASGLTQPAFCKQDNVPFNKFQYRWSKKSQASKERVKTGEKVKSIRNSFEPISLSSLPTVAATESGKVIELTVYLPNQIRCEIKIDSCTNGFSTLLKQLVSIC